MVGISRLRRFGPFARESSSSKYEVSALSMMHPSLRLGGENASTRPGRSQPLHYCLRVIAPLPLHIAGPDFRDPISARGILVALVTGYRQAHQPRYPRRRLPALPQRRLDVVGRGRVSVVEIGPVLGELGQDVDAEEGWAREGEVAKEVFPDTETVRDEVVVDCWRVRIPWIRCVSMLVAPSPKLESLHHGPPQSVPHQRTHNMLASWLQWLWNPPQYDVHRLLGGLVNVPIGHHLLLLVLQAPLCQFLKEMQTILPCPFFPTRATPQFLPADLHRIAHALPERADGAFLEIFQLPPLVAVDPADWLGCEQGDGVEHVIVKDPARPAVLRVDVIHPPDGLLCSLRCRLVAD